MLLGPSASPFEICGYLLRCCEKINPQRIKDTPAVNFSSRLGSTSPISKGLRKGFFQNGQGCPWFYSEATFLLRKNSRPEVYTDVHFWTGYFKRLTESYILRAATGNPQRIISDMDVGGFRQERVRTANSSLSSCTGMYNCLTGYFKRLTENVFSKAVGVCAAH